MACGFLLLVNRHGGPEITDDRHSVAEVRADQVRNFLFACGERSQKEPGVSELVLIRGIVQDFASLWCWRPLLVGSPRKSEMAESSLSSISN